MIAIMQKAATLDDSDFEQNLKKDREKISRLIVENQGLRELLQISQKYGTGTLNSNNNTTADGTAEAEANVTVQEANKISVETQTDSNANQC